MSPYIRDYFKGLFLELPSGHVIIIITVYTFDSFRVKDIDKECEGRVHLYSTLLHGSRRGMLLSFTGQLKRMYEAKYLLLKLSSIIM